MADLSLFVKLALLDQLTQPMGKASQAVKGFSKELEQAAQLGEKYQSAGRNLAMIGAGAVAGVGKTLGAFNELEAAQVQLKNSMSTVGGMDENWDKINQLAVEAGNVYPGTTADFLNLAAGMKQMGMDSKTMTEGAFKGAAALQVMFKLNPAEAGESFVQMAKGMGIAGKDSMAFADAIQRVSYAAGLKLPEIKEAMKYMGASLKQLGVEGMENSKTVLAMMGGLRQAGVEGSQIGTTVQGAFSHMATMAARLKSGKGEIMKEAQEAMTKSGVQLQFFDKEGKFMGMENFLSQFDKLKGLSEEKRLMLGKALFGEEGSKMALLDQKTMQDVTRKMLQQEDIKKRLDRITGTLGNKAEAAQGSFTNLLASIGEKLAPKLVPVLDKLNDFLGWIQAFTEKHPKVTAALAGTVGGLGLLTIAVGGSLWGFGKLITAGAESIQTFKLIGGVAGTAAKGVVGFGKDLGYCVKNASSLREGITVFAQCKFPAWLVGGDGIIAKAAGGFKSFGAATWGTVKALAAQAAAWAMTPWGMITIGIVAVATGAVLLYKNWDKVTKWFKSAWSWFQGLWAKCPTWVKWLFPMINIAMMIIQNWGKVKGVFVALWPFMSGMVKQFWNAGANIAKAIWEGIKSAASKPVEAIKGIVTKIRRFLPFSPAKEGPLMDIHRIKLVETIASGIKPTALVSKMGQVARAAVPSLALALPGGAAGAKSAPVTLNITVNVQGSAQDGRKLAQEMMPEIVRQLEAYQDRMERRKH